MHFPTFILHFKSVKWVILPKHIQTKTQSYTTQKNSTHIYENKCHSIVWIPNFTKPNYSHLGCTPPSSYHYIYLPKPIIYLFIYLFIFINISILGQQHSLRNITYSKLKLKLKLKERKNKQNKNNN